MKQLTKLLAAAAAVNALSMPAEAQTQIMLHGKLVELTVGDDAVCMFAYPEREVVLDQVRVNPFAGNLVAIYEKNAMAFTLLSGEEIIGSVGAPDLPAEQAKQIAKAATDACEAERRGPNL